MLVNFKSDILVVSLSLSLCRSRGFFLICLLGLRLTVVSMASRSSSSKPLFLVPEDYDWSIVLILRVIVEGFKEISGRAGGEEYFEDTLLDFFLLEILLFFGRHLVFC